MQQYRLKAKYENQVFRPEQPPNLADGAEVTLIVVPRIRSFVGILEGVKEDSVTLQHMVKDIWGLNAD
jgi:predicted DNA-binding antitoxin AbrB/MazE fold protein